MLRERPHAHPRGDLCLVPGETISNILLGKPDDGQLRLQGGLHFLPLEVPVHARGDFMACVDRLDDEGGTARHVAGGKDAGSGGCVRVGVNRNSPLPRKADARAFRDKAQPGPLAHRENDAIALHHVLRSGDRLRATSSGFVGLAQFHAGETHPGHPPLVVAEDFDGVRQIVKDDAFLLGVLDFEGIRGRLVPGPPVVDVHFFAHAYGGSRTIHGHVTCPDDDHTTAELGSLAHAHVPKEDRIDVDPLQIYPGNGQENAFMGADRDEHRVEALAEQVVEMFHGAVQPEVHAEVHDVGDLPLYDLRGQPVLGHAYPQHAACHGQTLKDGDRVPQAHQIAGSSQAAGARADDGDTLLLRSLNRCDRLPGPLVDLVGDEALEGADVDGLIQEPAVARVFAPMVADAAADARKGVVFLDHAKGVVVAPLPYEGDVALCALARGTGVAARGNALLLYGVSIRHSLGVELVSCPLHAHALIEVSGNDHGTDLGALPATRAFRYIYVAGLAAQGHREMTRFPVDGPDLGIGHELDIEVPCRLYQFRADNAHGAVVRGEGLVELGHPSAYGSALLTQIDLEAGVGKVQCGLHAADTAAHHHDRTDCPGFLRSLVNHPNVTS